jgi:hypothetical protein
MYINYTYSNPEVPTHKATHLSIPIICEFYPDGSVYVKLFVKFSFTTLEMESILKATVNPILRVIKEHVEQGGFQMTLFTKLYHPQIELINLEYFAQLPITKNIEIKQMIKCISSAFNEIEGSLKKGIVLRYKRVSNYNDMSSQDAYIIEMLNKRQSDNDILEGLRANYTMSESEARAKFASILSSLQTQQLSRFRGGAIRIKNNPGFLTKITKGSFNNIITMEVSNINNILFLPSLHVYLDSIIRIYQNPGTTEIPYQKIEELCKVDAPLVSAKKTGKNVAEPKQNKTVLDEDIETMPEIVPIVKKPLLTSAPTAKAPVFGFEAEVPNEEEIDLFDLLQGDGDDDDDENDGDKAQDGGGDGDGDGGGDGDGDGDGEPSATSTPEIDVEEDLTDITGMELKNPNPFSKRIQERDPIIHLNEGVGKFNAYSRSCPWNVRRQPVILTTEEKERIDREHPGSYSHSITYGSDPNKSFHYICPRYWSLKHNTSLTEEEVNSGKYGTVIPQNAKKIPSGATIFEFTDDKYHIDDKGNYKQHYPGFLEKDKHPKGLCVPCCFAQWDKPSQTARRNECQVKKFETVQLEETTSLGTSATPMTSDETSTAEPAAAAATAAAPPVVSSEPVKINEMKDDRILSSDKFPLENNRWGYLPIQVQKFLFSDSRNCQVSLKNTALKKDTPCLLRRGVETNERQSFVSVIAYFYKESIGTTTTAATKIKTKTKTSIQDEIAKSINEETANPVSGNTLKDRITKSIAENIQKHTLLLSQGKKLPQGGTSAIVEESAETEPIGIVQRPEDEPVNAITSRSITLSSGNTVPTIREMRNILIQSLTIESFMTLHNGTLTDVFYNPNKEVRESDITNKYNGLQGLPQETVAKISNAYENFIAYLDDDNSVIDHTYLWDIVSRPNERLFKNGNNIILIHIPDDDITNNVEIICPTNAHSGEVFDSNRNTIFIMKRESYYEPIYLFESKSNGKFSVLGRFALKSKTLMPKIKYIIEKIRDVYFSYCRLNASLPREYKYKMNQPASVIAKLARDSGFEINAQVMNYNGKVIGLQISKTISVSKLAPTTKVKKSTSQKYIKGVIPTAVSAPLSPLISTSAAIPTILISDDDTLWTMSYRETVDFLETVARQIKKITNNDVYCRAKVKVVEDGIVVGVITETNQFIQVNIDNDPQLNQDDGIPTITESNHLIVDKEVSIASTGENARDKTREKYVRNIRLETNFYNVFRNTARNVLNRPENKAIKDDIEKLIASPFVLYQNKLSQIITHIKQMLSKYIAFIRYSKTTLKMVGEISGCITSDDETCGKKSYCLKESGGFCKLLIPQRNLMYPHINNEIAYFGKLADEMIRYERVKLFMFEPTKYLSFQNIQYNLQEDEIILLETFITQEYFENMEPVDENPYLFQTNFYTVPPSNAGTHSIQNYDPLYRKEYVDRYLEITGSSSSSSSVPKLSQATSVSNIAPGVSTLHINEINHMLDFCREVSKRKITEKIRKQFFPTANAFEILFSNESNECSFDVILTILRITAQNASKCPSGHSCVPRKQSGFTFGSTGVASANPETEICRKCRDTIGHDQTEYACHQCNYFICEHCRIQHVDELAGMTISRLKNILVSEYGKFSEMGLDKKLTMIMNGYGMKKYAGLIQEGRATLPQIIQSENYFLTNVDIWIFAVYFKIPIVFISQTLLSENGENVMVAFRDHSIETESEPETENDPHESYFFIHPFSVSQDVPSRYGMIEVKENDISLLRIPLQFVSQELREHIRNDEKELTIEEYIRKFKLGDIKHKKRIFAILDEQNTAVGETLPENTGIQEEMVGLSQ